MSEGCMESDRRIALDDLSSFDSNGLETVAVALDEISQKSKENVGTEFSEDSLARLFSERHGNDWRYIAAWNKWVFWNGSVWKHERTLHVFDLARNICRSVVARLNKPSDVRNILSASTMNAVEKFARSDRRHAAKHDQWDCDPLLLNTPSGVVNLRTGYVAAHDPSLYLTKITRARIGNTSPRWMQFLNEITNGDAALQAYLKRVAGYCATGLTSEQVLFFPFGPGGNGKTCLMETLADALGDYATVAPSNFLMESRSERHPTELAKLMGARLVLGSEVPVNTHWDDVRIKQLTGGDTVTARFMRMDFFDFRPFFKLIVFGNNKPNLSNVDEAIRRRLQLIPLDVVIPPEKRDRTLQEKLRAERDGVLKWIIEGAQEWSEYGLNPPNIVQEATADYFSTEDDFGRWINEDCLLDPTVKTETRKLFNSWQNWVNQNNESLGGIKQFTNELGKRGFKKTHDPVSRRSVFLGIAPLCEDKR